MVSNLEAMASNLSDGLQPTSDDIRCNSPSPQRKPVQLMGHSSPVSSSPRRGHCVATFQSWEWHDPRLTYAWQQTDTEIKVYISFDQSEDHLQVSPER